jgi:hypothetical protein
VILSALLMAASSFGTPPAERAPTTTVVETEPSSLYYRGPRSARAIILRHGVGLDWRLPIGEAGGKIAFGYDLLAGGRIGLGNGRSVPAIWPEIGWTYVGSGGHFLSAGIGPAIQNAADKGEYVAPFSWGVVPRFLYGTFREQKAVGFRLSVLGESIGGATIGIELAYQFVHIETTDVHEIRFAVTSGFLFGRKGEER